MQALFERHARYNRWMNRRLYAMAAGIGEEQRRADRGAFFRSIHGTLNHLMRRPMWVELQHLFNHQTHHRGQVTTLLMQAGIDPGVTDIIAVL